MRSSATLGMVRNGLCCRLCTVTMEVIHQIVLEIQTNDNVNITERRFPSTIPISDLKCRLELITGASAATMKLTFKDTNGQLIGEGFDSKTLGDYHLPGGEQRLRLLVTDSEANRFADVSSVPKFELSEEEYAKRTDSVRAFKMRHKLGQFGDKPEEPIKVDHIKVGDRCEVTVKNGPARRGQVKYVGKLGDKAGLFVGICCDEPNGKNDGSFEGVRYFDCRPNYGIFVRPNDVQAGDYPEEEINFDD